MTPHDKEIKFYSIQFSEWCLKYCSQMWVNEECVWLYRLKHYDTEELYDEYLEYLKTVKQL